MFYVRAQNSFCIVFTGDALTLSLRASKMSPLCCLPVLDFAYSWGKIFPNKVAGFIGGTIGFWRNCTR